MEHDIFYSPDNRQNWIDYNDNDYIQCMYWLIVI